MEIVSSLRVIAEAAIYLLTASVVFAIFVSLLNLALVELIELRKSLNGMVLKRFLDGNSPRLSTEYDDPAADGEDAGSEVAEDAPDTPPVEYTESFLQTATGLPYRQMCAQLLARGQIQIERHNDVSQKGFRAEQKQALAMQDWIDRLQIELGRLWLRAYYVGSCLVLAVAIILINTVALSRAENLGTEFALLAVGIGAVTVIIAPLITQVVDRWIFNR